MDSIARKEIAKRLAEIKVFVRLIERNSNEIHEILDEEDEHEECLRKWANEKKNH